MHSYNARAAASALLAILAALASGVSPIPASASTRLRAVQNGAARTIQSESTPGVSTPGVSTPGESTPDDYALGDEQLPDGKIVILCGTEIDPDQKMTVEEKNAWSTTAYGGGQPQKKSGDDGEPASGPGANKGQGTLGGERFHVPIIFHVITTKDGRGTWVTTDILDRQVAVLNASYEPQGITFERRATEIVTNDDWYYQDNATNSLTTEPGWAEREMKETLNTYPDPNFLHVYLIETPYNPSTRTITLGWARFPWWYDDVSVRSSATGRWVTYDTDPRWDGICLCNSALPNGRPPRGLTSAAGLSGGKALVHEAGHWLGLYHTFQGDHRTTGECVADAYFGTIDASYGPVEVWEYHGDMVHDTPTQSQPTANLHLATCGDDVADTCPSSPGFDPVRNIMNYNALNCLSQFTPGQRQRMLWHINTYRPYLAYY